MPLSGEVKKTYLIALTYEGRCAAEPVDLALAVAERFSSERVRPIERGYKGYSLTVEMSESELPAVRAALPFATIETDSELNINI
jgi:hypothetical protein